VRLSILAARPEGSGAFAPFTLHRQEVRPFTDKQIAPAELAAIRSYKPPTLTEHARGAMQYTATADVLSGHQFRSANFAPVFRIFGVKAIDCAVSLLAPLQLYENETPNANASGCTQMVW